MVKNNSSFIYKMMGSEPSVITEGQDLKVVIQSSREMSAQWLVAASKENQILQIILKSHCASINTVCRSSPFISKRVL